MTIKYFPLSQNSKIMYKMSDRVYNQASQLSSQAGPLPIWLVRNGVINYLLNCSKNKIFSILFLKRKFDILANFYLLHIWVIFEHRVVGNRWYDIDMCMNSIVLYNISLFNDILDVVISLIRALRLFKMFYVFCHDYGGTRTSSQNGILINKTVRIGY